MIDIYLGDDGNIYAMDTFEKIPYRIIPSDVTKNVYENRYFNVDFICGLPVNKGMNLKRFASAVMLTPPEIDTCSNSINTHIKATIMVLVKDSKELFEKMNVFTEYVKTHNVLEDLKIEAERYDENNQPIFGDGNFTIAFSIRPAPEVEDEKPKGIPKFAAYLSEKHRQYILKRFAPK